MRKMFKLNNKGMTTVEILVSFILVAVISASLYTTVSNYNRKLQRESNKLEINTFKNTLTKIIQDDLIKNGLINVQTKEFHSTDVIQPNDIYIIDLKLKDNSIKRLAVRRQLAEYYVKDLEDTETSKVNDEFNIYYGTPTSSNSFASVSTTNYMTGLEEFPIPDLGYGYNDQICGSNKCIVKDFRLINVNVSTDNKVLSIFLGFQHIDEGTKYAINIVCPIDYQTY